MKIRNIKSKNLAKQNLVKRSRKSVFIFGLISLLILTQIIFALGSMTSGNRIAELEQQEAMLIDENKDIEYKIVKYTSLSDISKKANELGYNNPVSTLYIKDSSSLAKLP